MQSVFSSCNAELETLLQEETELISDDESKMFANVNFCPSEQSDYISLEDDVMETRENNGEEEELWWRLYFNYSNLLLFIPSVWDERLILGLSLGLSSSLIQITFMILWK